MSDSPRLNRATFLNMTQYRLLEDWAMTFDVAGNEVLYLVGSALTDPAWRDVDVRLILDDAEYGALDDAVSIRRLNFLVSMWAESVTRLPVDFQVQSSSDSRAFDGRRHPLAMS